MFEKLKYEDFADNQKTIFNVLGFEEIYTIELNEVSERKTVNDYEMFSLIFSGPREYLLPQQLYKLSHEKLGEGEIFIVPIEQKENGFLYQAVFNRRIETATSD